MLFSGFYFLYVAPAVALAAVVVFGASVRILREYERGAGHRQAGRGGT